MHINHLNHYLSGTYQLSRLMTPDHWSSEGVVTLEQITDNEWAFTEKGVSVNNHTHTTQEFYQKRIWQLIGDTLAILKEDRSILHKNLITLNQNPNQFPLGALVLQDVHHCGKDNYDFTLVWLGSKHFHTHYHVTGPFKNYHLYSCYCAPINIV